MADVLAHHAAPDDAHDPPDLDPHDDLPFQVFDLFQVMTDGGPQDQTRALSLDIYRNAFRYQRMGWAAAVSVVLFSIVFMISIAQTRLLRSRWEY